MVLFIINLMLLSPIFQLILSPVPMWIKKTFLIYWFSERERKGERDIHLLSHRLMHSLVVSCMCPDQRSNPQPWQIKKMLSNWATQPGQGNEADLNLRVKGARFEPEFCYGDHLLGKSLLLYWTLVFSPVRWEFNTCATHFTGLWWGPNNNRCTTHTVKIQTKPTHKPGILNCMSI